LIDELSQTGSGPFICGDPILDFFGKARVKVEGQVDSLGWQTQMLRQNLHPLLTRTLRLLERADDLPHVGTTR
jgi:hypothetical protein